MKARLVSIKKETPRVKSYFFKTQKPIKYIPGHFVYLTLPKLLKKDKRGGTREFSISSSPTEGNLIRLTVKDGISGFKKTLQDLKLTTEVDIDGSHGVYTWDDLQNLDHVFIAGGIGITPFRSRVKYNLHKNLKTRLTLLYSISSLDKGLFLDEFNKTKNLELLLVNTQKDPRINKKFIKNKIKSLDKKMFWICGSTNMVNDIEDILLELQIRPENIKTEKFTGY